MKKWFYLSFVNRDLPEGGRWVGASMVMGTDLEDAIQEAWRFGVNGGGEVASMELPEGTTPREGDAYRLITDPEEARNLQFVEA